MIDVESIVERQRDWEVANDRGSDDAREAARVALRGVVAAARQIHANLKGIGYPEVPGWIPPSPQVGERVERIRAAAGALPQVLNRFWRDVGGIEFVDIERYAHVDFWANEGFASNPRCCDGVYLLGCDEEATRWFLSEIDAGISVTDKGTPLLELSPDALHKDNVSGGLPYCMEAVSAWNAPLLNFQWTGPRRPRSAPEEPPDLLVYLRSALLECAGFPGYYGYPAFESIRSRLLDGVALF